jgi:tetratricopeptide (TPR) repeat protein
VIDEDAEALLADWHDGLADLYDAADPEADELADTSRYQDAVSLATGGQKEINVVCDAVTGRQVALARPKADDPTSRARFVREVKLTSRLRHPNVVAIHDLGQDERGPYAVMSLLGGASLQAVCEQESKPSVDDLLDVLLKVCDALAYAHAQGVLHLDLKPANVQVGEFGDVYLLDWGLARLIDGQAGSEETFSAADRDLLNDLTLVGTVKGTPGFMAPEQANPEAMTGVASDVYALGALLFYVLTGKPRVQGDSVQEVISRTQLGQVSTDSELPASLASIISKATALEPGDRYASVAEFRAELLRFGHGFATAAEDAGIGKQLRLLYQRNRATCHVAGTMLAVLLIATTVFVHRLKNSRDRALAAEQTAIAARSEAEGARLEAEEALRQVKRERKTGAELERGLRMAVDFMYDAQQNSRGLNNLSVDLTKQSKRYSEASAYHATITMLEQLLKRDPDHEVAWRHLACVRLVVLDFPGALQAFEQSADSYPFCAEMLPISRKYVQAYGDRRDLTPAELAPILHDYVDEGSWRWTRYHLIQYDRFRRDSIANHAQVVRAYLEARNPRLQTLHFDFQMMPDGNHLSLANSAGLEIIEFAEPGQESCFATLDLKSIDLRGTDVSADQRQRLAANIRVLQ